MLACGVEMMTRVPLGANMKGGSPLPKSYSEHYAFASQFQGAEMIAKEYGITREDTDRFGLRSQQLAIQAWEEGRFEREIVADRGPGARRRGQARPARRARSAATRACARRRSRSWPR